MAVGIKVSNLTQQNEIDGDVNIHIVKDVDGTPTSFKTNVDNFIYNNSITTAKLNNGAVTTAKITDANVTFAKLADVIDDDTMATASATKLATSESIKAYTDTRALDPAREYNSLSHSTVSGNIQQNTTGRPLWVSFTFYTSDNADYLLGAISPNENMTGLTRIGQMRVHSDYLSDSGVQVTMIVPSQWYWRFSYIANQGAQEIVHCSFAL